MSRGIGRFVDVVTMVRDREAIVTGALYGAGAGALWGLVFLAPELAHGFTPLQQTIGRYLCFGLISALLLAPRWRALSALLGREEWLALAWLALAGNTIYYVLLASAVQLGGIAMTSLIVGFIPVTVTIIGSRDRDAVALSRLMPSILLCAAGTLCIGWQALASFHVEASFAPLIGLLCAVGALASWTAFAVGNSRWLARLDTVPAHDWNLLIGIMTGVQSLFLLPVALGIGLGAHSGLDWTRLAAVSIGVALLASITGNALWNRMSRLLPLTMVGQMIVFETLFALIYAFLWEQRLPTMLEAGAFALVIASVFSCVAAHRRPAGAVTGAV